MFKNTKDTRFYSLDMGFVPSQWSFGGKVFLYRSSKKSL